MEKEGEKGNKEEDARESKERERENNSYCGFLFQAEDGIRDAQESRGLGDVYKRQQWGLDADTAARRLYVLHDGTLTSGIPAFLVLWAQMPKYRWLARVVGFPGIKQIACLAYDHVLAPAIYRWHLRRLQRQTVRVQD